MSEQFEIKNTKSLQLKSLQEFAKALGYTFDKSFFWGLYTYGQSDKNTISFRTMVTLHNEENLDNHGQVYERFGFSLYDWERAKGGKIVEQVFLTLNKKTGYVYCHKHLVKFTRPFYERIFLGDDK